MKLKKTIHDIGAKRKNAARILHEEKYDMVHIHMKRDEAITTHHAQVETLIIVRSGKVSFTVKDNSMILTNEEVLQMDPFEEHSLHAMEESDVLLIKIK